MFDELPESIIRCDEEEAKSLTQKYPDRGKEPEDILKNGLIAGMDVVGQRFRVYEMYLPEVIMSATAMKSAMGLLKPMLSKTERSAAGKFVMATIEGDVHDIGKNLVTMMLEGAGCAAGCKSYQETGRKIETG